ncbi:hypothetical protein GCM10017752_66790 [Streptomyces roseoviridis]
MRTTRQVQTTQTQKTRSAQKTRSTRETLPARETRSVRTTDGMRLPAPHVVQAPDGHLPDAQLGGSVTVRVSPEGGVTTGQTYTLLWAGGRGRPVGYTDAVSVGRPAEHVEFEVPPAFVSPHLDQVVPVTYTVEDGEGERSGDTLLLRIGEAEE